METNRQINKWAVNGRVIWLFIKYQLVTKGLLSIVVLPLFSTLTNLFINLSGRTNLSSGDYLGFFFSIYGIPVILLGIFLLILIMGIDINTFIIISSLSEENKLNMKMKAVLLAALKSIKLFFSPLGVVLVLYAAIILPLLNIGVSMGPLKNFKIPNFITSVIFNNPLYSALYYGALILLFIISIIYIFSIHFILLDNKPVLESFRSSRKLMQKYWKRFIADYFIKLLKVVLIFAAATLATIVVLLLIDFALSGFFVNENVAIIVLLLSTFQIIAFFTFMLIPIAITILTKLFYKYNKAEGRDIKINLVKTATVLTDKDLYNKIKIKTKVEIVAVIIIVLAINLGTAAIMETYFEEIFKMKINVELIAHRGGGDLGAENTIQGIEVAIKENVSWAEIDVQRTADGKYVINHDPTFKRVAGVDKTPMEMTLEEIKQLQVKNEFQPEMPAQPVPTFEELLDACKGKIGVFVELKGKSADYQMVDDVVKMIEQKNMLDECVILSLDYDIIEYTAANYPQIKTGFLYFFSIGALEDLKGDYLIMEEREATPIKIEEIHEAGKKAIVWTVNTPESIDKFIKSDVDGIITDYVMDLKVAIAEANQRTHFQILLDSFSQ